VLLKIELAFGTRALILEIKGHYLTKVLIKKKKKKNKRRENNPNET
jgi:hypothetical protein